MSKDELKYEISQVLDRFSNEALQELLQFLKLLDEKHHGSISKEDHLQKILSEDKELLEKLAQ